MSEELIVVSQEASQHSSNKESVHSKSNLVRFLPNILYCCLSTFLTTVVYVINRIIRGEDGVSVQVSLFAVFAGVFVFGSYRVHNLPEKKRATFNFRTCFFVVLRSLTNLFAVLFINLACRNLQVDTAAAIIFMSPVISSFLSMPVFNTKFDAEDARVFFCCLFGVVLSCEPFYPSPNNNLIGFLWASLAAFSSGVSPIASKLLTQVADTAYFFKTAGVLGMIVALITILLVGHNTTFSQINVGLTILSSLVGVGQLLFYEWSFQKVDVRLVVPFLYLSLVYTFIFNLVIFSAEFSVTKFIGVSIIFLVNMKDVIRELFK